MSAPKLHHALAQFYQHGFCRDEKLWVFDRERVQFRKQSPKVTAAETHLYSLQNPDGSKDTSIESILASYVEGPTKPIITKLENGERITEDERGQIAMFAAFMKVRTPEFRRNF